LKNPTKSTGYYDPLCRLGIRVHKIKGVSEGYYFLYPIGSLPAPYHFWKLFFFSVKQSSPSITENFSGKLFDGMDEKFDVV